jgi:hypothetical protein
LPSFAFFPFFSFGAFLRAGGAVPSGLVVLKQSQYSGNNSSKNTAPYGHRVRWKTSLLLSNGEKVEVDSFDARLKRMQCSIHSWVDFVTPVSQDLSWDWIMVTLTYKNANDWSPSQITRYTEHLKRYLKQDLHSYCWVAELQERGAVHYHLIACVSKGIKIPFPDKPIGHKNFVPWPWGFSKVERAEKPAYLVTYVGKAKQKDYFRFPLGARGFGIWIAKHVPEKVIFFRENNRIADNSPVYVKEAIDQRGLFFTDLRKRVKREPGRWMIGVDPLNKSNAPPQIFWDDRGRIRFKTSVIQRILFTELQKSEFVTLKALPITIREEFDLWYQPSAWIIDDEVIESGVSVLGFSQADPKTWVSELMQREPKEKKDFSLEKRVARMKWEMQ